MSGSVTVKAGISYIDVPTGIMSRKHLYAGRSEQLDDGDF